MMKKLLLFILILMPFNAFAINITCDETNLKFSDYFTCKLTDIKTNVEYEKITGTLKLDDYINCTVEKIQGASITDNTNLKIDIKGTFQEKDLIEYKCQVVGKPNENVRSQLLIENFITKEKDDEEKTEIVRSSYLNIEKYSNVTTTTQDTKPRDTSNRSSLLKNLTADEVKISFSTYITRPPAIQVEYEIDKITLHPEVAQEGATYEITGATNLSIGTNEIDICVTSVDLMYKTCYTYTFERLPRGEKVYKEESDSTLSNLGVTNTTSKIDFDKKQLEYTIHIGADINHVDVTAIPTSSGANISIKNTSNLKNGSIIEIVVTSKDESSKTTYKIKVIKARKKINILPYLAIIGFASVVIFLIYLIIKTNNRKNDDPILRLKKDKRKINMGEKLDASNIQVVGANPTVGGETIQNQNVEPGTMVTQTPVNVSPQVQVSENQVVQETLPPQPVTPPTPVVENNITPVNMPNVVEAPPQPVSMPTPVVEEKKETNIFDNPNT